MEESPGGLQAPGSQTPACQVCALDLTTARTFFKRYRICEEHAAAKELLIEGATQRFCQQCGRFHALDAFDSDQRSCREELARHAARRRDLRKRKKGDGGARALWEGLPTGLQLPMLQRPDGYLPHTLSAPLLPAGLASAVPPPRRRSPSRSASDARASTNDPFRFRTVTMVGRPGQAANAGAASPWAGASLRQGSLPLSELPLAELAAAAAAQEEEQQPPQQQQEQQQQEQQPPQQQQEPPLQEPQQEARQAAPPPQQHSTGPAPPELQQSLPLQLLKQLPSTLPPVAASLPAAISSGILSTATAVHLPPENLPGLAAAISALAGQAGGAMPPGLAGLDPAMAAAAAAAAQMLQQAVSDSGSSLAGAHPSSSMPSQHLASLLQQVLATSQSSLQFPPTIQSLPTLPEVAPLPPMTLPLGSLPPLPMAQSLPERAALGAAAAAHHQPQGPVCQICRQSLADLLPFYKRYRVCAEHMSAREVQRDGVPQRFCQQCGRFHPLDAFDGTQRTCREELAWRRYRRSHAGKADGKGEGRRPSRARLQQERRQHTGSSLLPPEQHPEQQQLQPAEGQQQQQQPAEGQQQQQQPAEGQQQPPALPQPGEQPAKKGRDDDVDEELSSESLKAPAGGDGSGPSVLSAPRQPQAGDSGGPQAGAPAQAQAEQQQQPTAASADEAPPGLGNKERGGSSAVLKRSRDTWATVETGKDVAAAAEPPHKRPGVKVEAVEVPAPPLKQPQPSQQWRQQQPQQVWLPPPQPQQQPWQPAPAAPMPSGLQALLQQLSAPRAAGAHPLQPSWPAATPPQGAVPHLLSQLSQLGQLQQAVQAAAVPLAQPATAQAQAHALLSQLRTQQAMQADPLLAMLKQVQQQARAQQQQQQQQQAQEQAQQQQAHALQQLSALLASAGHAAQNPPPMAALAALLGGQPAPVQPAQQAQQMPLSALLGLLGHPSGPSQPPTYQPQQPPR